MLRRRKIFVAISSASMVVMLGTGATVWALNGQLATPSAPPSSAHPPGAARTPSLSPTETRPEPTSEPEPEPAPSEPVPAAPQTDLDNPSSLTVVVNKARPLNPIGWAPSDLVWPNVPNSSGHPLRATAATALEQMYAAAQSVGLQMTVVSGYRSYAMQEGLFNSYAQRDGVQAAERYSARPGHSEHQTGLAVDLDDGSGCAFSSCFGQTATGTWLGENAHQFGFILRYHDGQEATVGYLYEPWHFRYVGTEIASDMRSRGLLNLEDYFGLPAAPSY